MSSDIPWGVEDETNEHKSVGFLDKDAVEFVRPIVSFLNTRGGTLWIGIREQAGTPVPESVPDPEKQLVRIHDRIRAAIEPVPGELDVKPTITRHGGHTLIRIEVKKGRHGPYAAKHGRYGREYLMRAFAATREMTLEELRARFSTERTVAPKPWERIRRELESYPPGLFLFVITRDEMESAASREAKISEVLQKPERAGNRPMGWTFHGSEELTGKHGRWTYGPPEQSRFVVFTKHAVIFRVSPERLRWAGTSGPDPDRALHPLPLIEYPVSALRLARLLLPVLGVDRTATVDVLLALKGLTGWTLRPHSDNSIGHQFGDPKTLEGMFAEAEETTLERLQEPNDRVAILLLQRLYEWIGFKPTDLPQEIDRETGLLRILPPPPPIRS